MYLPFVVMKQIIKTNQVVEFVDRSFVYFYDIYALMIFIRAT